MALKLNTDIEVRVSKIEGKGLFARRPFTKGDTFPIVTGKHKSKIMSEEEFEAYKKSVDSWDSIYLGNGKYEVSLLKRDEDPSNFGNHSCDPNIAPLDDKVIALRDIAKDEELTIDYSQFSAKDWSMNCNCGSTNCRHKITGIL